MVIGYQLMGRVPPAAADLRLALPCLPAVVAQEGAVAELMSR
jgi:hypothetical protein